MSRHGASFYEMPLERRLVMKRMDARGSPPGRRIAKFKCLVLLGYYQSEIGATHELRFELVPGAWRSCLPLSEVGRASAV